MLPFLPYTEVGLGPTDPASPLLRGTFFGSSSPCASEPLSAEPEGRSASRRAPKRMDRRFRPQPWRRTRHNYYDLCPPIGRRAAAALLWLSCSIALLRALVTSHARAQQRAAGQQRRSFLNAHHRSVAQVIPEPPESDQEQEEVDLDLSLPECLEYEEEFDYEAETESEIESDTDFDSDPETAPTTEPETEPEDERGPPVPVPVPKHSPFGQPLTERLQALRLRSPDASPTRAQSSAGEPQSPPEGEKPEDKDPKNPEESEEPKERQQQRRCKPKKPTRRDPSPESPSKKGPIPIRRH